jgi:tRNA(fMet)-specific endonuclease VapC
VLLLDVDLLISHLRTKPDTEKWLIAHTPAALAISTVTIFEIESGVHFACDPEQERRNVARVLSAISVHPFDADGDRHATAERAAPSRCGSSMGPHDTLLAGHALALGARVVTDNQREFKHVRGLRVEAWREPTKR